MAVFSFCSRPPGPCWWHGGFRKAASRLSPPHSSSGGESRKKPLNQRAARCASRRCLRGAHGFAKTQWLYGRASEGKPQGRRRVFLPWWLYRWNQCRHCHEQVDRSGLAGEELAQGSLVTRNLRLGVGEGWQDETELYTYRRTGSACQICLVGMEGALLETTEGMAQGGVVLSGRTIEAGARSRKSEKVRHFETKEIARASLIIGQHGGPEFDGLANS